MRGFLAIELDDETRAFLSNIKQKFKNYGVKGNYSFPDNLHLTLLFLGEIDGAQVDKISAIIKNIASNHNEFVLKVETIGKFNKGSKMILWAGLKKSDSLQNLYDNVKFQIDSIVPGLDAKGYTPHITLVREAVSQVAFSEIQRLTGAVNKPFTAAGLSLMESTRVNGRLTYIRRAFEAFLPG